MKIISCAVTWGASAEIAEFCIGRVKWYTATSMESFRYSDRYAGMMKHGVTQHVNCFSTITGNPIHLGLRSSVFPIPVLLVPKL